MSAHARGRFRIRMEEASADGCVSSGGAFGAGLSATVAVGAAMSRWRDCSAGLRPPHVVVSGLAAKLPACRPAQRAGVLLAARRGGLPPAPGEKEPGRLRDGDMYPTSSGVEAGRRPPGGRKIGSTYPRRAGCAAGRRLSDPPSPLRPAPHRLPRSGRADRAVRRGRRRRAQRGRR